MTTFNQFGSLFLLATFAPALFAESHCPGNVASLPFRLLIGYHIVVPVTINRSGPYEFLLDTGTRMTMVGASLADELHLDTHGTVTVAGLGFRQPASLTQLDLLEAGSHAVTDQRVLVYSLLNLRSVDSRIRGILGEDFLKHFDVLIDYAHHLLCLDDTTVMRAKVRGSRIALLTPVQATDAASLPNLLIIAAHLSGEPRPVRLMLDSGTNVPYLYSSSQQMRSQLEDPVVWNGPDGDQKLVYALHPQAVRIGSLELPKVAFLTLALSVKDSSTREFDGFLAMNLFRYVFISHADHFAILQPR